MMSKRTKIFGILSIVSGTLFFGAMSCNSIRTGGNPTPTELKQDIADIKTSTRIATRVYILTIEDVNERAKTEAFARSVASQALAALKTNTIAVEQVRGFASNLINKSSVKHRQLVGLLLDSVAVVIEERMNTDLFHLQGDDRTQAISDMIEAAVEGVMEATSSIPTTQP